VSLFLARECPVWARDVEMAPKFRLPSRTGGPASISITRSVEEYPSGHHRIPSSSFYGRCLSEGGSIDFQWQLFYLLADSRQTLRDSKLSAIFALAPSGLKVKKFRGWGSPFGGNFMGKLKLWPQISRPLIIRGRRFGVGSTRGLGPYVTS